MLKTLVRCAVATAAVALPATAQEQAYAERVMQVADTELQSWITDPVIVYAILEQNARHATMTEDEIARLDTVWRTEDGFGAMTYDVLGRQASVILRDRRAASAGVITEIIVMDAYGLNVAISDATSDYYQGDEAKYRETFLKGVGAVHVSDIALDESTLKVQTQVSMTVTDPDSRQPIGAVTFGINLDVLDN